jgi:hypothetical protein
MPQTMKGLRQAHDNRMEESLLASFVMYPGINDERNVSRCPPP